MVAGVTIKGWEELKKALAELPKATQRNVQVRVLMKHAQPIVATAKALAPKGETLQLSTGILATTKRPRGYKAPAQRAFAQTLAAGGSQAQARAAAKEAGSAPVLVFIGPDRKAHGRLHVDIWQEFGTKFAPAHPYMRPAMDQHRKGMLEGIGKDMGREIEAAGARLAKKRAKAAARAG